MIDGTKTTRPLGESEPVTVGEIKRLRELEAAVRPLVARTTEWAESLCIVGNDTELGAYLSRVCDILDPDRDRGAA